MLQQRHSRRCRNGEQKYVGMTAVVLTNLVLLCDKESWPFSARFKSFWCLCSPSAFETISCLARPGTLLTGSWNRNRVVLSASWKFIEKAHANLWTFTAETCVNKIVLYWRYRVNQTIWPWSKTNLGQIAALRNFWHSSFPHAESPVHPFHR